MEQRIGIKSSEVIGNNMDGARELWVNNIGKNLQIICDFYKIRLCEGM
jgi:hypothetical protein